MSNVFDVAKYILEQKGHVTAMKLQKLVYYCQAWALVWDEAPLFKEKIRAWINGPVVPELYVCHEGLYQVVPKDISQGKSKNLSKKQKKTINKVLDFYGDKSSQWLSDLTHYEMPWKKARKGMPGNERGNKEVLLSDMEEYYSSIPREEE